MIKQFTLAAAALAMGASTVIPTTPAAAQGRYDSRYDRGNSRGYDSRYDGNQYRGRAYNNYRARQQCKDGDGGTIIGAIAGGLLGRVIAGRGDKTLATVIGAGAGALGGRAIDRSDRPDYCRR